MSILKKVYNELIGMDNLQFHLRMPKGCPARDQQHAGRLINAPARWNC